MTKDTPTAARAYTLRPRSGLSDSSKSDNGGRQVQSKKQVRDAEEEPKSMREFPTLKEATKSVTPQANKRHKKDSHSSTPSHSRKTIVLEDEESSDDDDVMVKGGNSTIHLNLTTRCTMKIRFAGGKNPVGKALDKVKEFLKQSK